MDDAHVTSRGRLREIAAAFGKLGLTSFGGPVAHLGYFRAEIVEKRKWLDDAAYADLVALCQFLPGPASSQVAFGLGLKRGGLAGAFLASLLFTLPSALLMIAFAYGVRVAGDVSRAGWLHGLKLAAVAVVAQAVWAMGRSLCPDRFRITLAIVVAAALLCWPAGLAQVLAIAAGAALGWMRYRHAIEPTPTHDDHSTRRGRRAGAIALLAFLAILVALPLAHASTRGLYVATFDAFYRTGSLVFGGGHVILPLLRAEVVPRGWLSDDAFLAGYGAAQAVPGPLFTFAAYLGTAIGGWPLGVWCVVAIFLPSWLLVGGAMPFWERLRRVPWARAALFGANAAVVGVLLAALYRPVMSEAIEGPRDVAVALLAFTALHVWRVPAWAVVVVMAAVGQWMMR